MLDSIIRVILITEGGRLIGFGHITRCTSLYEAFEKKGISPVFLINGDETVIDLLSNKNYEIFNWIKEEEKLLAFIKQADMAIIDSYLADMKIYEKISVSVKAPAYMDDNNRIDYPRGIVANGTVYAEELNYPKKQEITYLLGSQYIPIRKEFWDVPDKTIRKNITTIMVTFGGDDARDMTPKVIKLLNVNIPEVKTKVIIGKAFKNTEQIESLNNENIELIYYPDAEGMKKIMLESDIAISAAGQTLYELARIGVPTIAVAVAENQMNNVRGWQRAGFVEYAGCWEDESVFDNIVLKLKLLQDDVIRQQKSRKGKALVDGLGATRIISHCIRTFFDKRMSLRKAEIKDMQNIYDLSNDSEVRKRSFRADSIDIETHKKWFADKIKNPNCLFLIAETNNRFLGQLRFEKENDRAVISISVVNEYRQLGVGRLMVEKGLHILKTFYPDVKYIIAFVKIGNDISKAFFENLNFRYEGKKTINNQDAIEYRFYLRELQTL